MNLNHLFYPKSVAVVGAAANAEDRLKHAFIEPLLKLGFEGQIYLVNFRGGEVLGLKVYPNIKDIPDSLDNVILTIPAPQVPDLVEKCVAKKVKFVTLFTAGFSEIGEMEKAELENKIVQIAHRGNTRIVGPNCMGVYCPQGKVSFSFDFPQESGHVGFISQSGGNSHHLVRLATERGVRFSKVISFGNACDLNESDFLEYLASDPNTEIIAIYVEGTKDGPRFFKVLSEAARIKPVVMLKGGRTEAGTRATAGHTGSLAGSSFTWKALCKQTGTLQVFSLDEMADMLVTLLFMSPPRGHRAGIIGLGGGASVVAADECELNGIHLPQLPPELKVELRKFVPDAGNSFRNPIDLNWLPGGPDWFADGIRVLSEWDGIDFIIAFIAGNMFPAFPEELDLVGGTAEAIVNYSKRKTKPLAVVLNEGATPRIQRQVENARQKLLFAKLPVYPTAARAARAVRKLVESQRR